MEWTDFKRNMFRTELQEIITSKSIEKEFWRGYRQGLRRRYHGEKFRTEKEHKLLMIKTTDNCELSQKIRAIGYESGYKGMTAFEAEMKLTYLFHVPPVSNQKN
ncbi:MAG: hypothetical protein DDT22_01198 [candidate division WS2 bacterium]|nr:hypothetical protein [Candidatus Lithacetigena glycinireducens]